jgi:hypothetical protein
MKPLVKFDDSAFTMTKPNSSNIESRINIDLAKNITLPRLMKDTTSELLGFLGQGLGWFCGKGHQHRPGQEHHPAPPHEGHNK